MALITRLGRLFRADFHAVLDRIEEPDIQLRQAVREMEVELERDEQARVLKQHEIENGERGVDEIDAAIGALDEELDICLEAGEEDLARDLVRRKLESSKDLQMTRRYLDDLQADVTRLDERIERHRELLDNMKQKLALLTDDNGPVCKVGFDESRERVRDEEVEIALLREKQRRVGA